MGGIVDQMTEHHKNKFIKAQEKNDIKQIKCMQFKPLFDKYNITHIDIFSLDVEGAELQVLEVMDWNVRGMLATLIVISRDMVILYACHGYHIPYQVVHWKALIFFYQILQ